MMTSFLRPLTWSALASILILAPLAGTGLDPAALHTPTSAEPSAGATYPRAATASRTRAATTIHLAGLATGAKPKIAWIKGTHLNFLTGGDLVMHRADRHHTRTAAQPVRPGPRWGAG